MKSWKTTKKDHLKKKTAKDTHTHTHIYIYIYIYCDGKLK